MRLREIEGRLYIVCLSVGLLLSRGIVDFLIFEEWNFLHLFESLKILFSYKLDLGCTLG